MKAFIQNAKPQVLISTSSESPVATEPNSAQSRSPSPFTYTEYESDMLSDEEDYTQGLEAEASAEREDEDPEPPSKQICCELEIPTQVAQ